MAQASSPPQLETELQKDPQATSMQDETRQAEKEKLPAERGGAALEQIFACLKVKDDTQRFVGLTLLMRYLEGIQGEYKLIMQCWAAIPASFLTRLIRAKATNRKEDIQGKEEAQIQFELGITILHTFMSLLSTESIEDILPGSNSTDRIRKSWKSRIEALVVEVPSGQANIKTEILQILLSISSALAGSYLLYESCLASEKWTPILSDADRNPLVLEIISRIFLSMSTSPSEGKTIPLQDVLQQLDVLLCITMKTTYAQPEKVRSLFDWLYELLAVLPNINLTASEPRQNMPDWLNPLLNLIHTSIAHPKKANDPTHQSLVLLIRLLLDRYPQFGHLFFSASPKPASGLPYIYIFTTTLLIDLRATIPALPELQPTSSYAAISTRLAASYDLVFAHLTHLFQEQGDEADDGSPTAATLSFDLLLKLRDAVADTMHLTTESLRDRYDACSTVPSAAARTASFDAMATDPLTVSQIGAVDFWLREDDSARADDVLDVALRLYLCNDVIKPLCVGVLEILAVEHRVLVMGAEEMVESMGDMDEARREELERDIRRLPGYVEWIGSEDDDDGDEDDEDSEGYDYD